MFCVLFPEYKKSGQQGAESRQQAFTPQTKKKSNNNNNNNNALQSTERNKRLLKLSELHGALMKSAEYCAVKMQHVKEEIEDMSYLEPCKVKDEDTEALIGW